MAEETIEFTPEEEAIIGDLLEDLSRPPEENPFSPMANQFNQEIAELEQARETEDSLLSETGGGEIGSRGGLQDLLSRVEQTSKQSEQPASLTDDDPFASLLGESEQPASQEAQPSGDDFDLGDLDSEPAGEASTDEFDLGGLDSEPAGETSTDDFDLGDLDSEPAAEASTDDFDLGDLDSEPAAEASTDDFDLGDLDSEPAAEASTDDFDLGDLDSEPAAEASTDDFDLGGLDAEPAAEASTDDFDLGGLDAEPAAEASTDDFDLGGLDAEAAGEVSADDFDLGGLDAEPAAEASTDDFDLGDLDSEPAGETTGDDLSFEATGDDLSSSDPFDDPLSDVPTIDATPDSPEQDDDLGSSLLDTDDLAAMTEAAEMSQGIGEDLTDEDLAIIRTRLTDYPPGLKKAIIDSIVEEKIPRNDQKFLVNMVRDEADQETIASFLEERLGYKPDTRPSKVRTDGVEIIYADNLSPEEVSRKKQRAKILLIGAGVAALSLFAVFGGISLYHYFSVRGMYERGLDHLSMAADVTGEEKQNHVKQADELYHRALKSGGSYNIEYMNRYGVAYLRAGQYDRAFVKLFGKVSPDYDWTSNEIRAPLIRKAPESNFYNPDEYARGKQIEIIAEDGVKRKVLIPGAYIVSRIRDQKFDRQNLLNLGKFHSTTAPQFLDRPGKKNYKNDELAIDYYRLILTLMDRPDDTGAMAGIGQVYFDRKEYGQASRQYQKILDTAPMDIEGHSGLLSTYLEIYQKEKDPRFVIERHRLVRKLGLEDNLPIYLMSRLAGFYTSLSKDELRIKYQVDPIDSVSGLDLRDNAIHLLELVFNKEETRGEKVIEGSSYGEGFYRRGQFLIKENEGLRALRQFQNAHKYDDRHFPAINEMGQYYMSVLDYQKAAEYFTEAIRTHEMYKSTYGIRPEDRTLMEADVGKIYHNLGSLLYLRYAGVNQKGEGGFPGSKIYPDRASRNESEETLMRKARLREAADLFEQALSKNMKDEKSKIEAIYRLGWIHYMNGDFESALLQWDQLETVYDYNYNDPSLLMGRGNAYYYTDQSRSALGSYLKVESDYERRAMEISMPNPSDPVHRDVFSRLAAVYNNIGAIYEKEYLEKQQQGAGEARLAELESEALQYYWKSTEASRKIDEDNEIARSNTRLAFRPSNSPETRSPLLDDWVSPALEKKSEDRRGVPLLQ